jgi:hypothetical protein
MIEYRVAVWSEEGRHADVRTMPRQWHAFLLFKSESKAPMTFENVLPECLVGELGMPFKQIQVMSTRKARQHIVRMERFAEEHRPIWAAIHVLMT